MFFKILSSTVDFFSCVTLVFWTALFESTYVTLLLDQCFSFRGLMIRLKVFGKLLPNLLIIHSSLTPIIIVLYYCYDVTFCIWSLHFVYVGKKLTKQTNKTVTRLAKRSFKIQSKIRFNVMQVFMNNYMNDDSIRFFKHQYRINARSISREQ